MKYATRFRGMGAHVGSLELALAVDRGVAVVCGAGEMVGCTDQGRILNLQVNLKVELF